MIELFTTIAFSRFFITPVNKAGEFSLPHFKSCEALSHASIPSRYMKKKIIIAYLVQLKIKLVALVQWLIVEYISISLSKSPADTEANCA
jgi:hypothetical protein